MDAPINIFHSLRILFNVLNSVMTFIMAYKDEKIPFHEGWEEATKSTADTCADTQMKESKLPNLLMFAIYQTLGNWPKPT